MTSCVLFRAGDDATIFLAGGRIDGF